MKKEEPKKDQPKVRWWWKLLFWRRILLGPLPVEIIAQKIVKKVTHSAFRMFRAPKIRKMLKFSEINQTEQDRMFNEFMVTGFGLAILMIEMVGNWNEKEEMAFYFQRIKEEIADQYLNQLKSYGISDKFVELWRGLIRMRCDEYRQDYQNNKEYLPDPHRKNPWVQVTAISGLHHLRRGKTSPQDPLFQEMLKWLYSLAIKIEDIVLRAV